MITTHKAMLIDITRCIGCGACAAACKQAHGLPEAEEKRLSPTALTVIEDHGGKFVRRLCMHCEDPTCVSVCPVGALTKSKFGPVTYEADRCIGCRYCLQACPFQVPRYEWDRVAPYMKKCDFCAARVEKGEPTACAAICPTGATQFGDRDALLAEAKKRIEANPAYVRKVYGSEEVGGTSILFLSDVPFEKLGFMQNLPSQPMPTYSAAALTDVPVIVSVGASMLAALYWITQRRAEVALAEGRDPEIPGPPSRHSDEERS